MLLENITMKAFKEGLEKTRTMIVPYGTVEAHGTHLPLSTDTMVMVEVAKQASERRPVFVAPPVHFGVCTSTGPHPGTITISCETLRALTKDIVRDGHKKGIERFILISGHGGSLHVSAMKEAAEILTAELPAVSIAALSIYEALPKDAFSIAETENDSHAGELETSLILHLAPELVDGRAAEEYPNLPRPITARDKLKCWPGAVWGNPGKASAEKGEKLMNIMVDCVVELVGKIDQYNN